MAGDVGRLIGTGLLETSYGIVDAGLSGGGDGYDCAVFECVFGHAEADAGCAAED